MRGLNHEQKPLGELNKELRKYTKRFLVYFIFTLFDTILGSLLFLYIENCYDPVPRPLNNMEQDYTTICSIAESKNIGVIDDGDNNNNNTKILLQIVEICKKKKEYVNAQECELNLRTFSMWFEYTASIAFTTGKRITYRFGHQSTRTPFKHRSILNFSHLDGLITSHFRNVQNIFKSFSMRMKFETFSVTFRFLEFTNEETYNQLNQASKLYYTFILQVF